MSGPYLPGYDAWKTREPEYDDPLCEDCGKCAPVDGEEVCKDCLDSRAEAAYERSQEEPCFRGGEWAEAQAAEADWIRRNLK